mgnify:CR=1 FL=1
MATATAAAPTREAYAKLLERYAPEKIALEGGSAGANLVAATLRLARP